MSNTRRIVIAIQLALALVAGCDRSSTDRCFPVPEGEGVVATHRRGAALQGDHAGSQFNGTSLQRPTMGSSMNGPALQGPAMGSQLNGAALQGPSMGSNQNGAALQGPTMGSNLNGAALQGPSMGSNVNGAALQGPSMGSNFNGTALQGASMGSNMNGTSLEGASMGSNMNGTSLEGASMGSSLNGRELQGASMGSSINGTDLQGFRDVRDLGGVTIALAAVPAVPLVVERGALRAGSAVVRGGALMATTRDGRTFSLEVAAVRDGVRATHVSLVAGGARVCGDGEGVFVAGRWDATGAHVDEPGVVTYACMTGVIGKCVEWGYAPWSAGADAHQACTRMARADYCGDGHAWTLDGTAIDVLDRLGINAPTSGLPFEAAWGPAGAVCVAHTRYDVRDADRQAIEPRCLAALPTCDSLDAPAAAGALLANTAAETTIAACR